MLQNLDKLPIKGPNGLREMARRMGIKVTTKSNKKSIIISIIKANPNKNFTRTYDVNRPAPPPPPGMTQEEADREIKFRLGGKTDELSKINDAKIAFDIAEQREELNISYDKILAATRAYAEKTDYDKIIAATKAYEMKKASEQSNYDKIRAATMAYERNNAVQDIEYNNKTWLASLYAKPIKNVSENMSAMSASEEFVPDNKPAPAEKKAISSLGEPEKYDPSFRHGQEEQIQKIEDSIAAAYAKEDDKRNSNLGREKAIDLIRFYDRKINEMKPKWGGDLKKLLSSDYNSMYGDAEARFAVKRLRAERGYSDNITDEDLRQVGLLPRDEAFKFASEAGPDEYEGVISLMMDSEPATLEVRSPYTPEYSYIRAEPRRLRLSAEGLKSTSREEAVNKLSKIKVKKVKRNKQFDFEYFAENRQNIDFFIL